MSAVAGKKKEVKPYAFTKGTADYSNDPFFKKKHEQAIAFIKKHGLPEPPKKK